jgi:hypothetical protein
MWIAGREWDMMDLNGPAVSPRFPIKNPSRLAGVGKLLRKKSRSTNPGGTTSTTTHAAAGGDGGVVGARIVHAAKLLGDWGGVKGRGAFRVRQECSSKDYFGLTGRSVAGKCSLGEHPL